MSDMEFFNVFDNDALVTSIVVEYYDRQSIRGSILCEIVISRTVITIKFDIFLGVSNVMK